MDQDMPHRISAPSQRAEGAPRYSLVWKMVWFHKDDPTLAAAGIQPQTVKSQADGHHESLSGSTPGLCRPEWGPPIRLGSAGQILGQKAWQR